jgi:hypothetical protein
MQADTDESSVLCVRLFVAYVPNMLMTVISYIIYRWCSRKIPIASLNIK